MVFFTFKDTLHKPLEEVAAMFGDEDTVVVYQRELQLASVPLDMLDDALPEKAEVRGETEEVEHSPTGKDQKSWRQAAHYSTFTG